MAFAALSSLLAFGNASCRAASDAPSGRDPRAELLAAHEASLAAHRDRNWRWFGEDTADPFLTAFDGEIHAVTTDDQLTMFRDYLGRTEFERYEDLAPPIVSVSADGTLGWVLARVGVEGTKNTSAGARVSFADRWAWIICYELRAGRWFRTANVSGRVPEGIGLAAIPPDVDDPARTTLERARAAMGGRPAVASIESVATEARGTRIRATGERLPYSLAVAARATGDVHFDQRTTTGEHLLWTVAGEDGWSRAADGTISDLSNAQRGIARGHAFHLIALNPALRFDGGTSAGAAHFAGRDATLTLFTDDFGATLRFYHDARGGLPLGYVAVESTGEDAAEMTITFDGWKRFGTLRMFTSVRLEHRGDLFELEYDRVEFNEVASTLFVR